MKERYKMLLSYLKSNVAPILVDFISSSDLKDAIVLPANINLKELTGHYEGTIFMPPKWLNKILSGDTNRILVIDNIDAVSKEEQMKFGELLKYRKISTFDLPDNCRIIITAKEINSEKINEEIFSLTALI